MVLRIAQEGRNIGIGSRCSCLACIGARGDEDSGIGGAIAHAEHILLLRLGIGILGETAFFVAEVLGIGECVDTYGRLEGCSLHPSGSAAAACLDIPIIGSGGGESGDGEGIGVGCSCKDNAIGSGRDSGESRLVERLRRNDYVPCCVSHRSADPSEGC